jgi:ribonuclease HI
VDGSYNKGTKLAAYGVVFYDPAEKKVIDKISGVITNEEYCAMNNVGGEIMAVQNAIKEAKKYKAKELEIHYDYEGIEEWANDSWKANKLCTVRYKQYIERHSKEISISFVKVKAHSGDEYNDMADKLAKEKLGIK